MNKIVMINNNTVHSFTSRRKCLREINIPHSLLNPWVSTSQYNKPVSVNTENKIKDMMLTKQSFDDLLFAIRKLTSNYIVRKF